MPNEEVSSAQILAELSKALKESRTSTDKQLDDLSRKLELLVPKMEQLQRDILAVQADMRTMFVRREEYEPRHKNLEDRLKVAEDQIVFNRAIQERFFALEVRVQAQEKSSEDVQKDIENIDERLRGQMGRLVPWISVGLSAVALIGTILAHVQIR